jgi:hypothetical protein
MAPPSTAKIVARPHPTASGAPTSSLTRPAALALLAPVRRGRLRTVAKTKIGHGQHNPFAITQWYSRRAYSTYGFVHRGKSAYGVQNIRESITFTTLKHKIPSGGIGYAAFGLDATYFRKITTQKISFQ